MYNTTKSFEKNKDQVQIQCLVLFFCINGIVFKVEYKKTRYFFNWKLARPIYQWNSLQDIKYLSAREPPTRYSPSFSKTIKMPSVWHNVQKYLHTNR